MKADRVSYRECNVIGAGGHGKVVVGLLKAMGIAVAAVYDDDQSRWGSRVLDVDVVGPIDAIAKAAARPAVLAIGNNSVRQSIAERLDLDWMTLVHPTAWIDPSASLGLGTVVMPNATVHVDASVGNHVIVNSNAVIEHDCVVGEFAHLAPGCALAGSVHIGRGVLMGIGASAVQFTRIGAWSLVGAGSVVTRDIPPGCTAVGVPAKLLSQRKTNT